MAGRLQESAKSRNGRKLEEGTGSSLLAPRYLFVSEDPFSYIFQIILASHGLGFRF